jgi:hypothetical protein
LQHESFKKQVGGRRFAVGGRWSAVVGDWSAVGGFFNLKKK